MKATHLLLLLAGIALSACADPYRNLYEGIKASNDAKRTPEERAMTPAPGYDAYKKERDTKTGQ
jgi:hypothetical protein